MKYERKILVPYLENVLNLEMTMRALEIKRVKYQGWCNTEESYISNYKKVTIVQKKASLNPNWVYIGCSILGWLSAIFFFCLYMAEDDKIFSAIFEGMGWLSLISALFFTIFVCIEMFGEYEHTNEKYQKEYADAISKQNKELEIYQTYQKNLSFHREVATKCKAEYDTAKDLLEKSYAVNIIPSRYRNMYAISYLYEYFFTSKADDLDTIIQTLLLDTIQQQLQVIQQKLDQIIANQNDMISQLGDICKKAEQIKRNGNEQIKMLAQQEQNQQLQMEYLDMIEANTSATAYFSAATCFEIMQL